jgi:hypothetical protein
VEALLAAAASPEPPPIDVLMPDLLPPDALPEDLPWLLRLLPRADLYLQDEVELAWHPTLTRVWCPKGRRGQRWVEAPGNNAKEYGFGLVDWRDGWFAWQRAPGRRAAPLCAQLRRAVARSQARGCVAIVLLDNLGIHTPKGSLLLRALLEDLRGQLVLVYTPRTTRRPIASSGCGARCAGRSLTRTPAKPSRRCWRMPIAGHTPSPRPTCSARSVAPSLTPTSSTTRTSLMPPDKPGSI